jgi:hypothetical protein
MKLSLERLEIIQGERETKIINNNNNNNNIRIKRLVMIMSP